jgi:hypothetical protein
MYLDYEIMQTDDMERGVVLNAPALYRRAVTGAR